AYHPQTNGLTERFNKTLLEMLSMYVSKQQGDWDEYLPYVVHAYNTSVHVSTGETPFYLTRGHDARQPSFLDPLRIDLDESEEIGKYKTNLAIKMKEIRTMVNEY